MAVDDEVVAVADRAGRQACKVGARAGFGEQLTPDVLAAEARAEVAGLEQVAAMGVNGGHGHAEADDVACGVIRGAGAGKQFVHAGL